MRRVILAGMVVIALAGRAEALTVRDIIELTRAGVSEEVLLALIEVDRGVYSVDPETLKKLKAAGVSEKVMIALVRSGREPIPEPPPAPPAFSVQEQAPAPQVVVIEHHDEAPERVREVPVPVAVPVYIPVHRNRRHLNVAGTGAYDASAFVPFQSGAPAARPEPHQKSEPVYWGWGGKRRPDTWDPPPDQVRQPDRRK